MQETECTCRLCGYKWEPRVSVPAQCPRCKRYDWHEEVKFDALKERVNA